MSWLLAAVIAVAVAAVLVLTVALALLIPERRMRRQSPAPAALWRVNAVREVSPAAPVTARPSRALPGPQEFHLHLHGPLTAAQLDEVAAMHKNAVQAFDQYEGR